MTDDTPKNGESEEVPADLPLDDETLEQLESVDWQAIEAHCWDRLGIIRQEAAIQLKELQSQAPTINPAGYRQAHALYSLTCANLVNCYGALANIRLVQMIQANESTKTLFEAKDLADVPLPGRRPQS